VRTRCVFLVVELTVLLLLSWSDFFFLRVAFSFERAVSSGECQGSWRGISCVGARVTIFSADGSRLACFLDREFRGRRLDSRYCFFAAVRALILVIRLYL